MPPKRQAAIRNHLVQSKKQRVNTDTIQSENDSASSTSQVGNDLGVSEVANGAPANISTESGAIPNDESQAQPLPPTSGSSQITIDSVTLKNLLKEAFQEGLMEARANLVPQTSTYRQPDGQQAAVLDHTPTTTASMTDQTSTASFIGGLPSLLPALTVASQSNVDNGSQFHSVAIPLHARVPDKTKDKIWSHSFVELSSITDKHADSLQLLVKSDESANQSLEWVQKQPKSKTLSIDEWTNQFDIFMAVYCVKYPEAFSGILKYQSLVRQLAAKNADWRFYDNNFRQLRANAPNSMPWDIIQMELWNEAVSRRPSQNANQAKTGTGICHRFARGEFCNGCKYAHKCGTCGAKHAGLNCPVLHGQKQYQGPPPRAMQNFRPFRGQHRHYSPASFGRHQFGTGNRFTRPRNNNSS
ncbi:uncharacterized protein [Argopecten irradians]|uniref:uncharacterized protein isoform X1 n=1 Tax=Argopecten irradians TaxID=31199 RepID=UPI003719359F